MKITLDKGQIIEAAKAYLPKALRLEAVPEAPVTFSAEGEDIEDFGVTIEVTQVPDKRRKAVDASDAEST